MIKIITTYDWTVLHWIHNTVTCPALDYLMPMITSIGNGGMIWIVTALLLLLSKKYRRYGFVLSVGLLAGFFIGNIFLKNLIERSRPCWIDQSVTLLIASPTDYSFPSGHTLESVIAATILTMSNKKFGYIAIPVAGLIAFSRLYLYVHFPSDVLGAVFIGVLIGISVFVVVKRFLPEGKEMKISIRI